MKIAHNRSTYSNVFICKSKCFMKKAQLKVRKSQKQLHKAIFRRTESLPKSDVRTFVLPVKKNKKKMMN